MRFFHKFGSLNYNFLGLVNGILLSSKKKKKFTRTIDYLSKYEYVLDNCNKIETSDEYKNKIWQCWFQGKENMPEIVKKCTDSVRKYHDKDIIFLDKNNIIDYIQLPEYILDKHKQGIIPYANFSDICRLTLLAKYGGTWVDSTIYLTDKIPDDILTSDFFSFRSQYVNFLKYMDNLKEYNMYCNNFNTEISIESPYFLHAKNGNEIINGVLNLFLEYWKHENSVKEYLMIDKFFILTVLHNEKLKQQFINMPEYYLENVLLLQHALFEPFNQDLYNSIIKNTPVHKLTHKNLHRNPYKDSFLNYILKSEI